MKRAGIMLSLVLFFSSTAFAGPRYIGRIDSEVQSRVFNTNTAKDTSANLRDRRFSVKGRTSGNRLSFSNSSGKVSGPMVFGIKSGKRVFTVTEARNRGLCTDSNSRAVMGVKQSQRARKRGSRSVRFRGVKFDTDNSFAYVSGIRGGQPDKRTQNLAQINSNCAPVGSRLGFTGNSGSESLVLAGTGILASGDDTDGDGIINADDLDDDGDGMPDALDIDDDGDGILDNDDPDSETNGDPERRDFYLFSNFHLDFEDSINNSVMNVTKSQIDAALQEVAGLAIQVFGDGAFEVELDCGTLGYCSEGGTGRSREPYPNGLEFPEELDDDGDGFGTIDPGDSADFQLATNASSDAIGAGDVLIQRFTDENGRKRQLPGLLNFIFHTVPAAVEVVTDVNTYTPTYPVTAGDAGTRTNCFEVPAAGDVNVTLTVARPQRPGLTEAGEAARMDLGNLKLITNLPQGPCVFDMNGGCTNPTNGPGVCAADVYVTTDPNLTVDSDGLQDSLGDVASDPANTFSYTINISKCLTDNGISWNSGESLFFPLQMMNRYGDNAAQNICFKRQ